MKTIYTSIVASVVLCLFFIATTNSLQAQPPLQAPGCCRSAEMSPGGECIACEGQSCVTTSMLCGAEEGFFSIGDVCVTTTNGAVCEPGPPTGVGCCVVPPESDPECIDQVDIELCILGEGGAVWVGGESCSNVSVCQEPSVTRNVPSLSEWGLIALAGTLGVIGIIMAIRRNKVSA